VNVHTQTRRGFLGAALGGSSLIALAPTVPGFLARTARAAAPGRDGRVLVVLELNGGNDGINTVVPFADEGYAKHRKALRLSRDRLVKVDDRVGLHPSLAGFGKLLEAGHLVVAQGVSYPNPSRSHFQSMATWHTARLDPEDHKGAGWLGRALDEARGGAASLQVGHDPPSVAIRGRRSIATAIARIEDLTLESPDPRQALAGTRPGDDAAGFVRRSMLDAYTTADRIQKISSHKDDARYPESGLASRLRLIARLLKGGQGARVFYTLQPGYDTHAGQLFAHSGLLLELSNALTAFLDDLGAAGLADRVTVLLFSEFGRTVAENVSAGTDHGTAGPVFLAGPKVRGGVVGATPSLLDLDPKHGDLGTVLDFRRIYAAVLEDWLGLPAASALGGDFERLPMFHSA
jgi:uncharacterized protein (DUF1501 family)